MDPPPSQVYSREEYILDVNLMQGLCGYVIGLCEVDGWSDDLLLTTYRNFSQNYPALEDQVLKLSFQEKQEKLKEMIQQQQQQKDWITH
jgi:hypothetical protein